MNEPEKKWCGICLLCGEEIFQGEFIDANFTIHNCEPGRLLHFQGLAAYEEWLKTQKTVSWDEIDQKLLVSGNGDGSLNALFRLDRYAASNSIGQAADGSELDERPDDISFDARIKADLELAALDESIRRALEDEAEGRTRPL